MHILHFPFTTFVRHDVIFLILIYLLHFCHVSDIFFQLQWIFEFGAVRSVGTCLSSSILIFLFAFFFSFALKAFFFPFRFPNDFDIAIYGRKSAPHIWQCLALWIRLCLPSHNSALIYISSYCSARTVGSFWSYSRFTPRTVFFPGFFLFFFNLLFISFSCLPMTSISIIKSASSSLICIQTFRTAAFYCCSKLQMEMFFLKCFHLLFAVRQSVYIRLPYICDNRRLWNSKSTVLWYLRSKKIIKSQWHEIARESMENIGIQFVNVLNCLMRNNFVNDCGQYLAILVNKK